MGGGEVVGTAAREQLVRHLRPLPSRGSTKSVWPILISPIVPHLLINLEQTHAHTNQTPWPTTKAGANEGPYQ